MVGEDLKRAKGLGIPRPGGPRPAGGGAWNKSWVTAETKIQKVPLEHQSQSWIRSGWPPTHKGLSLPCLTWCPSKQMIRRVWKLLTREASGGSEARKRPRPRERPRPRKRKREDAGVTREADGAEACARPPPWHIVARAKRTEPPQLLLCAKIWNAHARARDSG